MDPFLFNEFIEWIDTFNEWMVYLVINVKSIPSAPPAPRVLGLFLEERGVPYRLPVSRALVRRCSSEAGSQTLGRRCPISSWDRG